MVVVEAVVEVVVVTASVVVVEASVVVVGSVVVVTAAVVVVISVVVVAAVTVDPEAAVVVGADVEVVAPAGRALSAGAEGATASPFRNQAHPPAAPTPTSAPSIARKLRRLGRTSLTGGDGSSEPPYRLDSLRTPDRLGLLPLGGGGINSPDS